MNLYFLIAFVVCLANYILHTALHALEYAGSKYVESKAAEAIMGLFMFAGYAGWGFMMYSDPVKIDLHSYVVVPIGLLIGLTGIVMFILSARAKKGFHGLDYLVTKGIYSRLRNPMYLGTIFIHIGFPLATRSLLTLASAAIWILLILMWKYMEERDLQKKFGEEYLEYKKRTLF